MPVFAEHAEGARGGLRETSGFAQIILVTHLQDVWQWESNKMAQKHDGSTCEESSYYCKISTPGEVELSNMVGIRVLDGRSSHSL